MTKKIAHRFAPLENWLMSRPELSPGAKIVYARMRQYGGTTGAVFCLQQTLADETGTTRRAVRRYVSELVEHGLITSARRGQHSSNSYRLLSHPWMNPDLPNMDGLDNPDLPKMAGATYQIWPEVREGIKRHKEGTHGEQKQPSDMQSLITFFCQKHEELRKSKYAVQRGRDHKTATEMLESLGLEECKARAVRYLTRQDKYCDEHGYTLHNMGAVINGLASGNGHKTAVEASRLEFEAMQRIKEQKEAVCKN